MRISQFQLLNLNLFFIFRFFSFFSVVCTNKINLIGKSIPRENFQNIGEKVKNAEITLTHNDNLYKSNKLPRHKTAKFENFKNSGKNELKNKTHTEKMCLHASMKNCKKLENNSYITQYYDRNIRGFSKEHINNAIKQSHNIVFDKLFTKNSASDYEKAEKSEFIIDFIKPFPKLFAATRDVYSKEGIQLYGAKKKYQTNFNIGSVFETYSNNSTFLKIQNISTKKSYSVKSAETSSPNEYAIRTFSICKIKNCFEILRKFLLPKLSKSFISSNKFKNKKKIKRLFSKVTKHSPLNEPFTTLSLSTPCSTTPCFTIPSHTTPFPLSLNLFTNVTKVTNLSNIIFFDKRKRTYKRTFTALPTFKPITSLLYQKRPFRYIIHNPSQNINLKENNKNMKKFSHNKNFVKNSIETNLCQNYFNKTSNFDDKDSKYFETKISKSNVFKKMTSFLSCFLTLFSPKKMFHQGKTTSATFHHTNSSCHFSACNDVSNTRVADVLKEKNNLPENISLTSVNRNFTETHSQHKNNGTFKKNSLSKRHSNKRLRNIGNPKFLKQSFMVKPNKSSDDPNRKNIKEVALNDEGSQIKSELSNLYGSQIGRHDNFNSPSYHYEDFYNNYYYNNTNKKHNAVNNNKKNTFLIVEECVEGTIIGDLKSLLPSVDEKISFRFLSRSLPILIILEEQSGLISTVGRIDRESLCNSKDECEVSINKSRFEQHRLINCHIHYHCYIIRLVESFQCYDGTLQT